jgi:hypothetical protein
MRIAEVNCDICRARMCTDGLLSKLRCAECRQIKFAQFRAAAATASLIALGGFFVWHFFLHSTERENVARKEARLHPTGLSPELIALRRRA